MDTSRILDELLGGSQEGLPQRFRFEPIGRYGPREAVRLLQASVERGG